MTGNLDMGGNTIKNFKPFVEDDSSQAAQNAQLGDVINFGLFHAQRGELKREINDVSFKALNRKNPDPMEDNIDMANHRIKGLSDGNENDDAVNVKQLNEAEDTLSKYINKKITDNNTNINSIIDQKIKDSETSPIDLVNQENVFKMVMDDDLFKEDDDDIHKVGVQNKDFHLVNKKTHEFKIDYDPAIGYYSTRLSIDLIYLDAGNYTMVFEMYVDDGITIDQIEGISGTLSGITTKSNIDGTKTRSIIHFSYNGLASGFNDLDIDIKLKSKTDPQTTIYVVVYGVNGNVNNVSVGLWDRLYYYDNDSIKYEVPIDMKSKKIKGVGDGSEDGDAVNVKQLNKATDVTKFISLILNYLLKDDNKYPLLKELYFPDSNQKESVENGIDTYKFNTKLNEDQITFYYVFKHTTISREGIILLFVYPRPMSNLMIAADENQMMIVHSGHNIDSKYTIPNKCLGKQLWFWIWISDNYLNVIFS